MWDILGNRAAVVLISVTCGCVLIYNAWGAILALAFSLLLVLYACYSLLVNDSLVSPHAYYVLVYLREAIFEFYAAADTAIGRSIGHVRKLWHSASRCYRERFPFRMDRRRGSKRYQLSSDSYAVARPKDSLSLSPSPSSRFGLIEQLSPIPRDTYRLCDNDTMLAYDKLCQIGDHHDRTQQLAFDKCTSTPIFRPDRGDARNGDVGLPSHGVSSKKAACSSSHTLRRGENSKQFSPEDSPWGTSISPKVRPRPAGVKTVQTIAGPLLASTRYNIDPKIYTDVSSPGLTTRLTKYATEARSKLTHQPQYGTGQFPKVNLSVSPIPLLNTKSTKMRIPVTVKLAPPEMVVRYSPPERQRLLSNIRHAANASAHKSTTSVVQVLREISLKRHASREDVPFEVTKKQRIEGLCNEMKEIMNERDKVLEETNQKRSRDDSSKSEEDLSPQNKSIRPAKRTKTQSCYDILNSLSSSANTSTGVKRKAMDFSRSGTPDFEKHFKSLESAQPSSSPILPQPRNLDTSPSKPEFKEIYSKSSENCDKIQESSLIKGILKTTNQESKINLNKPTRKNTESIQTDVTKSVMITKSVKLADKLFMRAEPERNERLKLLVEEQGNIKARFTTDNVEEIKKEDIRNMRKTNMKARLQSMFDAISGKAESRINPDVVIQADDVNALIPVTCSVSCATLSSSTITTNVNTTPITTAAIVPGGLPSTMKLDAKVATTFSLSNATPPAPLNVPIMGTSEIKDKTNDTIKPNNISIDKTKIVSIAPVVVTTESLQNISSSSNSVLPTFTYPKLVMETPPTVIPSSLPSFGITSSSASSINTSSNTSSIITNSSVSNINTSSSISNSNFIAPATTATASTLPTSINFLGGDKTTLLSSAFVPISTSSSKIETNNSSVTPNSTASLSIAKNTINISTIANKTASLSTIVHTITNLSTPANTLAGATFSFGSNKLSSSPVISAQASAQSLPSQSIGTSLPINSSAITNINSNNIIASSTSSNIVTTTSAPVQTSLFTFGNNTTSQTSKSDLFRFSQSGNNIQSANVFAGNVSTNQATSLSRDTSKPFNFTTNTSMSTTNNSFGANNPATTAIPTFGLSTASTFSLGTSTISTSSTSKPVFVFGAQCASKAVTTAVNNTAVFGTMNNNSTPAMFGTPTTTALQFRTPTTSAPQFGASTTATPQFNTPTTSIFVTTTSNTTTANIFVKANSHPVFGVTVSTPGTTNIFNSPKTTETSIFTALTNASSSDNPASSSIFSNANVNTNPTTTSSVFGTNTPTIFGQAKPATSFGTGTGIFGSTSTPLFGSAQTTTAPTFAIANASGSSTMTSAFDATNTTPAFGASSAGTPANVQNASTPAFGGTTSMFGTTDGTSVPAFGANATTVGAFPSSSTTNTFGGQNPGGGQNPFAFGVTSSGGATFGDNKSPFGATPATTAGFGSSLPSSFGTGTASNAAGNTNTMFFGNNQKDGQQNTTFSFTSTFNAGNNNSTTASTAPFQFGATTKPATTGFNFTAPPATPTINFGTSSASTFNPSTPGMFSIGSGSTAPRSRAIRTRKPR